MQSKVSNLLVASDHRNDAKFSFSSNETEKVKTIACRFTPISQSAFVLP